MAAEPTTEEEPRSLAEALHLIGVLRSEQARVDAMARRHADLYELRLRALQAELDELKTPLFPSL